MTIWEKGKNVVYVIGKEWCCYECAKTEKADKATQDCICLENDEIVFCDRCNKQIF